MFNLLSEKGKEDEEKGGDGDPLAPLEEASGVAIGDDAEEGDGGEEEEPDVVGGVGFVIGEAEGEEGEEGDAPVPEAEDGEGEDEEEKEVEESPSGEPVAVHAIGTEEGEESPAWREVEGDFE